MSFAIRILAALLITGVAATSCSQDGDQMAGLGPADPSALESAAGRGDVARVSALLSEGADPNYGVYTSPIFAVVDDREPSSTAAEVIRLLVDSGADIDGGGLNGTDQTPLHRAALRGHGELVQLLLDMDADACRRVTEGEDFLEMTALDIAREHGYTEVERILEGASSACE